jgi:hypothetical protein
MRTSDRSSALYGALSLGLLLEDPKDLLDVPLGEAVLAAEHDERDPAELRLPLDPGLLDAQHLGDLACRPRTP